MPLNVIATNEPGKNLFTRLMRQSDDAHWNNVTQTWGPQNDAQDLVTLTPGPFDGRYATAIANLGDAAVVQVYIIESIDPDPLIGPTVAIGGDSTYILSGNEVPPPQPISNTAQRIISQDRTWTLEQAGGSPLANDVVSLVPAGLFFVTVSMDFSKVLNPGTALADLIAVVETTSIGLTVLPAIISDDLQHALIQVASVVAGNIYTVKVTVTTTDGETMNGLGQIQGVG